MSPALNRLLLRLGRWPRRVAVLVCVVLAVSSAIDAQGHAPAAAPNPLARLRVGQVAVPVNLAQSGTDGLIHAGSRVGLLLAPVDGDAALPPPEATMIADQLLVLKVSAASAGSDGNGSLLVAADRATALRIARAAGRSVLAVVDKSP